ncbi:hypothetical protein LARI1_G001997 [Lachnellula arida]|uniref:SWIM-type domain-containing protein n=1 Tax=Lachnellula arida TaxID=1316785 RepID=A0A8T9BFB2_9HELO|nr:hypothetical protein LARI1_G001997 [Lachnellula arida]
MTTLPTPRTLLTTLLKTLTTPPQTPQPATTISTPTNPLHALPPSHRALLTTLHVLFPPGMLLQSLDLLDRGLVTRIRLTYPHLHPSQEPVLAQQKEEEEEEEEARKDFLIYQVRSSHQPSRFKDHSASKGQLYIVRLRAWNCTCAAFTFSSFPSSPSSFLSSFPNQDADVNVEGIKEGDRERGWGFGGLSLDGLGEGAGKGGGRGGGGVPVCKHLLACVLLERWGDVLGAYVKEREVGREEMAGLGG